MIPHKSRLLAVQRIYKTDAAISVALGVPEYLVSYWRRKKGVLDWKEPPLPREYPNNHHRIVWRNHPNHSRCKLALEKRGWPFKPKPLGRPIKTDTGERVDAILFLFHNLQSQCGGVRNAEDRCPICSLPSDRGFCPECGTRKRFFGRAN